MAVSPTVVAGILVKCARHCCICRRFRPLHLIVHHIVEQAAGGGDDEGNLIPICVSCHSDVHTQTELTRSFTYQELRCHRDNVYTLVAEGKLPAASSSEDDRLSDLSAGIIRLLTGMTERPAVQRPPLTTEAVEVLLGTTTKNQPIQTIRFDGGVVFAVGKQGFGDTGSLRSMAAYRDAVGQLVSKNLIEQDYDLYFPTLQGFLIADDILSAGNPAQ